MNFNFFWHNKLAKIRRCVSITFIEISPIEVEMFNNEMFKNDRPGDDGTLRSV